MRTISKLLAASPALPAFGALAHPGHGLGDGAHWHASDAWGWALALAVAAAVVWFIRRK
jgi:hypothetical protein